MEYEGFRQFADSWGLLYLFVVFLGVIVMVFLPGAKKKAHDAANIPLRDETPLDGGPK
ncbi:MAG TPA: cbb3-type cytochrome c oxidase subunit 3 [Devosia sp.]|nr:cbb3-type cytochrome c oxidase subunit 3 [Devosia sp.]